MIKIFHLAFCTILLKTKLDLFHFVLRRLEKTKWAKKNGLISRETSEGRKARSSAATVLAVSGESRMSATMQPELKMAAEAPFPICAASRDWCALLGVAEQDVLGCGFKVFDADFRPLLQVRDAGHLVLPLRQRAFTRTARLLPRPSGLRSFSLVGLRDADCPCKQSKVSEQGGADALSTEVDAALAMALEQRRPVYAGAVLELDAARASRAKCPPTRKVSLCIEPLFQDAPVSRAEGTEETVCTAPQMVSALRVRLMEQNLLSLKEAQSELASGAAAVLSQATAPHRITHVGPVFTAAFGLDASAVMGRSLKMIEGPLTQHESIAACYEAASTAVEASTRIVCYNASGRPQLTRLRVAPVMDNSITVSNETGASGQGTTAARLAKACGVSHCLWYFDVEEETFLESDALTDSCLGSAPKAVTAAAAPFEVIDANDAWCKACGRERSGVLGLSLDALGFR